MVNEKNPSGQHSVSANHSEMKTFQSDSISMKSESSRSVVNSTNWHSQNLIHHLAEIPESWGLTPIRDKSPLRSDWQHEPVIPRDELTRLIRDGQQLRSEKTQQEWHCRWTGYGLRTGDRSQGLMAIDVDGSTAAQLLHVSISYKASNTQKTLSAEIKAGYQLQPTSDISDVSNVSQPKLSNSPHSIGSRITVSSMVHKQHKLGWTGMVKAIDANTAKVLWNGDLSPSTIPLQELKLAIQQEVADKTRS